MSHKCVYCADECNGCMRCYDDDELYVPFDELPPPFDEDGDGEE